MRQRTRMRKGRTGRRAARRPVARRSVRRLTRKRGLGGLLALPVLALGLIGVACGVALT